MAKEHERMVPTAPWRLRSQPRRERLETPPQVCSVGRQSTVASPLPSNLRSDLYLVGMLSLVRCCLSIVQHGDGTSSDWNADGSETLIVQCVLGYRWASRNGDMGVQPYCRHAGHPGQSDLCPRSLRSWRLPEPVHGCRGSYRCNDRSTGPSVAPYQYPGLMLSPCSFSCSQERLSIPSRVEGRAGQGRAG